MTNDGTKCFIAGISAMMALRSAEEAIDKEELTDAKNEINDAIDYCRSGCLDDDISEKIQNSLKDALTRINNKEFEDAKASLAKVAVISFEAGNKE